MMGQYDVDAQKFINKLKDFIVWQHKMLAKMDHPGKPCENGGYPYQIGPDDWALEQCEYCALIEEGKKFMPKEKIGDEDE